MSDTQRRRNRNNRKRGSHFEKVGADFLDMDVVPYSGSNARFGYGDVRDSVWLGEFKNITIKDGRCRILTSWIDDNIRKANMYGLLPFLAWMPSGRSEKYVILDEQTFNKMGIECNTTIEIPKKSKVAVNIFVSISDDWLKPVRASSSVVAMKFGDCVYYMMGMATFRDVINANGLKGVRQGYGKSEI